MNKISFYSLLNKYLSINQNGGVMYPPFQHITIIEIVKINIFWYLFRVLKTSL